MIPAKPSRLLKAWFAGVVEGRLRKSFARLRVRGLEQLRALVQQHPIIFVSNHTAWWDPMFLIYLSTRLVRLDGYAMMDARNLQRLPFLGRLGGYGVFLDDKEDRKRGIDYSVSLLSGPGTAVWIFPQGRERPIDERPLGFKPGAALVAQSAPNARVLPVAFRYEFGSREQPDMLVTIGAALPPESDVMAAVQAQEQAVAAELDRVAALAANPKEDQGFITVFKRQSGWLARLFERLLGLLTRYR